LRRERHRHGGQENEGENAVDFHEVGKKIAPVIVKQSFPDNKIEKESSRSFFAKLFQFPGDGKSAAVMPEVRRKANADVNKNGHD
jgi:hypothetical protein